MHKLPWRFWGLVALLALGLVIGVSCSKQAATPTSAPAKPTNTSALAAPTNTPTPVAQKATPAPSGGVVVASPLTTAREQGAQLTPEQWAAHLGVKTVATFDDSGPSAWSPQPGETYFVSNSSTTWGATNPKNSVVIINARTKKTEYVSSLPDEWSAGCGSHNIGVSSDAKYIYLPALCAKGAYTLVINASTMKVQKVIQSLGRPHHISNFRDPVTGKELILVIDFNWNWTGSGFYLLDPAQDNAVVGGMSNGDIQGTPYLVAQSPDYTKVLVGVTYPVPGIREEGGLLVEVDPKTWTAKRALPVFDPIGISITSDNKWAWVNSAGTAFAYKVDLEKWGVNKRIMTGPGPWGNALSYDESKLYVADKGEGPGYGQQGRTMTIIDTTYNIVTNAVVIGRTTDHVNLSPDGKELWATSNADRAIWVVDTETEQVKEVVKMPNDGDTHGGVFVRYFRSPDGKLQSEVVAEQGVGLYGSARNQQLALLTKPRIDVNVTNSGFAPASVSVAPGATVTFRFVNAGGTSGGTVTLESQAMGIARIDLGPGQSKLVAWTAPGQPGQFQVTHVSRPSVKPLVVKVEQPAAQAQATSAGPRTIKINAKQIKFDQSSIQVKAGETVIFELTNGDDEKHNLFSGTASILSPDADPGRTVDLRWTAPSTPGTHKIICTYHPTMEITLTVTT